MPRCKVGDKEDGLTLWLVSHHHTQECLGGTLPPKPGEKQMQVGAGGLRRAGPTCAHVQAWEPPRMDRVPARAHNCLGPNTGGWGALL